MPNRCSITVNSTKASLAFVPLSHPLFSSTKPPFHLFHRTTLRFVSESTLSSALQSRSSVCFTHHPIRLFHKATLSFVGWVTPFLQRASFVCLTATFLFISFTDLPFRLLHQSFSLLHRPAHLFASQIHPLVCFTEKPFIAKNPVTLSLLSAIRCEDDLSHIFIIFDLIFWIKTCIHERKSNKNLRPEFPAKIRGESNALGVISLECAALYC